MQQIKRVLMTKDEEKYYVKDIFKDMHTSSGFIKSSDLIKDKAVSNMGKEFSIFNPFFIDHYEKIKRSAQIISLKEVGEIIAITGINRESIIVDAGAGSGALCCFLANIVKKVYSFDIRDDHLKIVAENKDFLNLTNLELKNHNIYEGIPLTDIDVITLDVPEPWLVLPHAKTSLKLGGFIVSYSPSIPQVIDFVHAVNDDLDFIHIKTVELIEREWEIDKRKVRPKTRQLGHTGFLSFARRI